MKFYVLPAFGDIPSVGKNEVYLIFDNWNDYGFVTSFAVQVFDEQGEKYELPEVKIGFFGQTAGVGTASRLGRSFDTLPDEFFSLGMNVEYYRALGNEFTLAWRSEYLSSINDVVWDADLLGRAETEEVFRTSHLRSVDVSTVRDQYTSVLQGEVQLTDFEFGFVLPQSEQLAGFDLSFAVKANSTPSSNMHAIIGRNGVGKTTLLNSMVQAVLNEGASEPYFYVDELFGQRRISEDYFSSVVSVSFSAFDPFFVPDDPENEKYSYIGLKNYSGSDGAIIKAEDDLYKEFVTGLSHCFAEERRRNRWLQAIKTLRSDENFDEIELTSLMLLGGDELNAAALSLIKKMSSGHTVVLLTMTLLVANLQERSLVVFDEPESHLHPPLLSALMRSLSQLLHTRNAVAIFATHSPVVLQEIPKSCVWTVFRSNLTSRKRRPNAETFGENVGVLTREVFGLEVERSGFHTVLSHEVDVLPKEVGVEDGYERVLDRFGDNLGHEARGILKAMLVNREYENEDEKED